MIDIHAHILPNVDDGSQSLDCSLEMLRDEVRQGVDKVVLTPHFRGEYGRSKEALIKAFDGFKSAVEKENIPISLYLGEEFYVTSDVKNVIKSRGSLGMAGSEYILTEFDYLQRTDIAEIAHELKLEGYKPIIAHVERYEYITLDDVYEIKKVGGLIQVNAASIVGANKRYYKKLIKGMFGEGFVDFVASDVHHNRQNFMATAYEYVKRRFGEDAADVTFRLNAERMIKG